MPHIISNFKILSKLNDEFLQNIKILWIIKSGVLIVTKDDNFYVFGENSFGCLGSGHRNAIQKPTIVEELCHKRIIGFANGYRHVIAYNNNEEVYCWGRNDWGELGNNTNHNNYKPSLNKYLSDCNLIDICCGSDHSLALNSSGEVYAWGSNSFGQLGIGCNSDQLLPKKVYGLEEENVITISCGGYHSMILTENGRVFSWGSNKCGQLGTGKSTMVFNKSDKRKEFSNIPKIISVKNNGKKVLIRKISCGLEHSLLLSRDGDIYVFGSNSCGQLGIDIDYNKQMNLPVKMNCETKFIDIAAHFDSSISAALSKDGIYYVWGKFGRDTKNIPMETDLKSFNELFIKYEKITYKPMKLWHDFDETFLCSESIKTSKYVEEFDEFSLIAFGNFGIVCNARNKKEDEIYAIKKIPLTDNIIDIIFRELKIMVKLRSDYVVKLDSAWIEKNYINPNDYNKYKENNPSMSLGHVVFDPNKPLLLHIQMELCSKTIRDVIKQLNDELNQKDSEEMTPIGYYITSELFKEIVEIVDYLHNKNPPIIHRDLKPTNIFIANGMSGRFIKLADFGLATIREFDEQSHTLGSETMKYMAPEVLTRKYDTKVDIFSLGVIIQELFNIDINK
jgi:alpha-tubulin suppressor-like RCC1 family protein